CSRGERRSRLGRPFAFLPGRGDLAVVRSVLALLHRRRIVRAVLRNGDDGGGSCKGDQQCEGGGELLHLSSFGATWPTPTTPTRSWGRGPSRNWTLVLRLRAVAGETVLARPDRRLHAIEDVDLSKHARQVCLDGLLGDVEPTRNFLVRQSVRDQPQDLELALGQVRRGTSLRARRDQRPSSLRRERRLAARSGADRRSKLGGLCVFQEVPDCSSIDCSEDPLAIGE